MLLSVLALMQVQDGAEHWAASYSKAAGGPVEASAPDPLLMGAICGRHLPEGRRDAGRFAGGGSASPCDALAYPSRERHVRRAPDVSFLERPRVDRVPVPYQLKQA